MSEYRQMCFFGKLPIKVTLHTRVHKVHPIREKVTNEGNPTLITSLDRTNRKHVTLINAGHKFVLIFLQKINMVYERAGPTEHYYRHTQSINRVNKKYII